MTSRIAPTLHLNLEIYSTAASRFRSSIVDIAKNSAIKHPMIPLMGVAATVAAAYIFRTGKFGTALTIGTGLLGTAAATLLLPKESRNAVYKAKEERDRAGPYERGSFPVSSISKSAKEKLFPQSQWEGLAETSSHGERKPAYFLASNDSCDDSLVSDNENPVFVHESDFHAFSQRRDIFHKTAPKDLKIRFSLALENYGFSALKNYDFSALKSDEGLAPAVTREEHLDQKMHLIALSLLLRNPYICSGEQLHFGEALDSVLSSSGPTFGMAMGAIKRQRLDVFQAVKTAFSVNSDLQRQLPLDSIQGLTQSLLGQPQNTTFDLDTNKITWLDSNGRPISTAPQTI